MLEGLVAWVLNNYLGKYVHLNTDQLSIALLSGNYYFLLFLLYKLLNLFLRKSWIRKSTSQERCLKIFRTSSSDKGWIHRKSTVTNSCQTNPICTMGYSYRAVICSCKSNSHRWSESYFLNPGFILHTFIFIIMNSFNVFSSFTIPFCLTSYQ